MQKINKSEEFWDKKANYFDREERSDEPTYLKIIEMTQKHLDVNNVVLDFGCATGRMAIEIADKVKKVHGIDISSKMIEAAKINAANISNTDFEQLTIFDKKLEKGSFDVILGFYILHLVEDTPKVIMRMNELLTPGGLLISATPCLGETAFLNILLSLGNKIGLVPDIKSFKISDLENSIANGNFEIVETECLSQKGQQQFIVAKKI